MARRLKKQPHFSCNMAQKNLFKSHSELQGVCFLLIFSCTLKFLPVTPDSFQSVTELEAHHSSEKTEVAKPLKPPNSRMCFPNAMNHIAFISSATQLSEDVYINFVWGSAFLAFFSLSQIPFLNETGRKLQVFFFSYSFDTNADATFSPEG